MKPPPFLLAAVVLSFAVPVWAEDLALEQAKAKFAAGEAKWNGNTARFTADETTEKGETWLTIVKLGLKLEAIAENASDYHGARAYFDGRYLRIAELTEEDRKALSSPEE